MWPRATHTMGDAASGWTTPWSERKGKKSSVVSVTSPARSTAEQPSPASNSRPEEAAGREPAAESISSHLSELGEGATDESVEVSRPVCSPVRTPQEMSCRVGGRWDHPEIGVLVHAVWCRVCALCTQLRPPVFPRLRSMVGFVASPVGLALGRSLPRSGGGKRLGEDEMDATHCCLQARLALAEPQLTI